MTILTHIVTLILGTVIGAILMCLIQIRRR